MHARRLHPVAMAPHRPLALLCLVLLVAAGCTSLGPSGTRAPDFDPSLVTGERLFGDPLDAAELPRVAVNEPDGAMRAYVARMVTADKHASIRFRQLFAALTQDGYFESVYTADRTLTAADTFAARGGNCLSYTNMFVALAREAGLDARYQVVDVPPSWDADSGFLIRYTHINVLLKNVSIDRRNEEHVVVDFNLAHPQPDLPQREVSDSYAESLFYANRSIALLREGRARDGFANLRRAIELAPGNPDLWTNLGAFYATHRDHRASVEAYQVALQIDPHSKAAYAGLARSYDYLGNAELAARYREKERNYRERNPYYHFALAQAAFEEADYQRSLELVEAAIDLDRRTGRFHLLKSLVELQLDDPEAAAQSFRRAQRHGFERHAKMELLQSLAVTDSS